MVLIETGDGQFADKIGKTLGQWGFTLHRSGMDDSDVALLDIRDLADDAFGRLYSIRQRHPGIEVVLINKPDNVTASIAGMKAGAAGELIVPFDTGELKAILTEAWGRSAAARRKSGKKSLLTRFSEAMMAATFAQAGDFEGALELLDQPGPRRTEKPTTSEKP